ncbi:glucose-6-phosphate dehydrogenase [Vaginisenegalia massiliensis]|uniref:glucose-6-phosphate dehydrogenase n=1 Tax=Vaginisenegalia massiliensis TaxID=2058294 RepID=UPI000F5208C4|nr:glucose-6-phosphate dehydrogenase [Vaginisenegalia massiliensis]
MKENNVLITLFGASGDLAARKLYPAIYKLYKSGRISRQFALIGTARRPWSDDYFRQVVLSSIEPSQQEQELAQEFISHFYYQAHDVTDSVHYQKLKLKALELEERYQLSGNRLFYLSTSPSFFPTIAGYIKTQGLLSQTGYNHLMIEKPFGHDLVSANQLQSQLNEAFDEDQIFRIDHYLGKEIVQGIDNLRFDNIIFSQSWNKDTIDNIQITLAETVGVEERGAYYEQSGVLRDMIQNHALQLLTLIAMDRPKDTSNHAVQTEKIKVLQHIIPYKDAEDVAKNVIRGQYGPSMDGQLNGYRQEANVAEDSQTESFLALRLELDLPQWQGVPFYIRSGKRMKHKATTIDVQFKSTRPDLCGNFLHIEISPDLSCELWLNHKKMGYQRQSELKLFKTDYTDQQAASSPDDYERLIYECMIGDKSHYAHFQEVQYAWQFVDQIRYYWQEIGPIAFPNYAAGTNGPEAAKNLLARDGFKWLGL